MNPSKLAVRAAGLCQHTLQATHYPVFGTVTYRDGEAWEPKQITRLMNRYRDWIQSKRSGAKVPYIWAIEPTQAGRPHYHFIIWVPNGVRCPKPDEQGWWTHGSTRVEKARNPARYLAKYLSKGWSVPLDIEGRCRRYAIQVRHPYLSRARLPQWLQYFSRLGERWRRVPRMGGFCNVANGDYWPSPWRLWPGEWGHPTWVGWGGSWPEGGMCNLEAWCRALGEVS